MTEENVQEKKGWSAKQKKIFLTVFVLLIIAGTGGYYLYLHYRSYISTDNAYVKEDFSIISPMVSGSIVKAYVQENQFVKKGELIAEIDPRDYAVKVSQAEMALIMVRNQVRELYAQLKEADAGVAAKEAEMKKAEIDLNRAKRLYEKQVIPKEQVEKAETVYSVAKALYDASMKEKERVRASIGEKIKGDEAMIKHHEEMVREARQQLGYTKLYAPQDGYIVRKTVEAGNVVDKGQPLMALVPMRNPYIEANFKETQVGKIAVGNTARIKIDLYSGLELDGVVESISAGTGVAFSLLPPENATGNWIKVVQRVPVKIKVLNPPVDKPLRLGLSCEVKVKISNR